MMRSLARLVLPLAAALLLVAGCGSDGSSSSTPDKTNAEAGTPMVGQCPADIPAVKAAQTLATVDLDGDGQGEAVRLTASQGRCANLLFAKLGDRYVTAQAPAGQPALSTAYGVEVPGHQGELLVTREDHPRGGFQLRLYAAGDGDELTELKVDGQALVPFVALDVQEHPLSVDCTDGGVVVTEAVPHEPPGVAFAWDIKRTSYAIDGTKVTPGPTEEIADNVLPAQLKAKYPDLVRYSAFKSCRSS
jgi:hypothetical protein